MRLFPALDKLSPLEFAQQLNNSIKENLDVDIAGIFASETDSAQEKAVTRLCDAALKRKNLTDANFYKADIPGDFTHVSNFLMTQQNADDYATLRGHEIKRQMQYVGSCLTKMLEAQSFDEASYYLYASGFLAIGNTSALVYITERQSSKSQFAAISSGLRWAPKSAFTTAAKVIIYIIRGYLTLINDASMFGMVLNNTDNDLLAGKNDQKLDIFVNTGKMTLFMFDQNDAGNPVAINGRKIWTTENKKESAVFAGFYLSEKREGGLYGTDGAMIFSNHNQTRRIAVEYVVPYSGENGCYIAAATDKNLATAKLAFETLRPQQVGSMINPPLSCAISAPDTEYAFLIASIGETDNSKI